MILHSMFIPSSKPAPRQTTWTSCAIPLDLAGINLEGLDSMILGWKPSAVEFIESLHGSFWLENPQDLCVLAQIQNQKSQCRWNHWVSAHPSWSLPMQDGDASKPANQKASSISQNRTKESKEEKNTLYIYTHMCVCLALFPWSFFNLSGNPKQNQVGQGVLNTSRRSFLRQCGAYDRLNLSIPKSNDFKWPWYMTTHHLHAAGGCVCICVYT